MEFAPDNEALDMFVGITGASQAVAIRTLQENHGDLNAAVNAFFNERDSSLPPLQREEPERLDYMEEDEPAPAPAPAPILQDSRSLWGGLARPMLDPLRSIFGGERNMPSAPRDDPFVSHPRDVRTVPIDWQDTPSEPAAPPNFTIQDVTGHANIPGGHTGGIVSLDDDDLPTFGYHRTSPEHVPPFAQSPEVPSVPTVDFEVEEEMIQAAIEASKRDAEQRNDTTVASGPISEDEEIARAVSLSLKTAEDEKRWRDSAYDDTDVPLVDETRRDNPVSSSGASSKAVPAPSAFLVEEPEEQPLLRRRSRRNIEVVEPTFPIPQPNPPPPQQANGDVLPSDEWGGISTEEHDEAVMLEAVFGGGLSGLPYPLQREFDLQQPPQPPQPLSPTVVAQRLLREQQDDEFLASLAADREKELKAKQEAEAENEKEKLRREEEQRKSQAAAELESKLAAKAESLPPEPTPEDENGVTILVRLPDGARHGRRFRKSDKLQNLFDFVDLSRAVQPGTYRLVRQYPRRAFTEDENTDSFESVGLTNKQEALFLETI